MGTTIDEPTNDALIYFTVDWSSLSENEKAQLLIDLIRSIIFDPNKNLIDFYEYFENFPASSGNLITFYATIVIDGVSIPIRFYFVQGEESYPVTEESLPYYKEKTIKINGVEHYINCLVFDFYRPNPGPYAGRPPISFLGSTRICRHC
ncbi:MAG: hypothetical protein ACNS62_21215 [Candidatus Cyclobacteriaceae bacterium M3_2C_046]